MNTIVLGIAGVLSLSPACAAMTDAQLRAAADRACTKHVSDEYPDEVPTKAVGHVPALGSEDQNAHFGVVVQVTKGDRWICLYNKNTRAIDGAGIIEE